MRLTVSFFNMSTVRTFLTGIFWVNFKQLHAEHLCFVREKLFELIERPVRMLCPLAFANRSGLPYAVQVFNGKRTPKCLRLLDKKFADYVVCVVLKSFLFARQFLQVSLGRFCSFRLQSGAKFLITLTLLLYLFTDETFASGVGSKINNTQINSENFIGFHWSQVFDVARNEQEELATMQNEVRFALPMLEHVPLSFTTNEGQIHSTLKSPEVDLFLLNLESQNPIIESDCSVFTKNPLIVFTDFICISDFRDCTHGYLSRELEGLFDGIICGVMEWDLSKFLLFPSDFGKTIASSIDSFKCLFQNYCLFAVGQESYLSDEFHKTIILNLLNKVKEPIIL